MTGARNTPRSPAGRGGPESGPLRTRTHASLSRPGGGAPPVTVRDFQDEATAKAGELQAQVDKLQAARDYKSAFNRSLAALQASLAREARRRPADVTALYRYFTEQNVRLVREMPGYSAEEDAR